MEYGQISNIKYQISKTQQAFTVIELLTVVFIMGLMATLILANQGAQRDSRNIGIAENQLVSSIRQIQEYTLSSRDFNGQAVQYYIIKFDNAAPGQYTIEAMYNVATTPTLIAVETDQLPQGIVISPTKHMNIQDSQGNFTQVTSCGLLSFGTPYAQALMNNGCNPLNPVLPYTVNMEDQNDDYQKIVTFVTNISGFSLQSDAIMNITLAASDNTSLSKTVTVNGITGLVSFQ